MRLVRMGTWLGWGQDLLCGLLEFTDVGVFEFGAEFVVGVFGSAGDSHPYILAIRG